MNVNFPIPNTPDTLTFTKHTCTEGLGVGGGMLCLDIIWITVLKKNHRRTHSLRSLKGVGVIFIRQNFELVRAFNFPNLNRNKHQKNKVQFFKFQKPYLHILVLFSLSSFLSLLHKTYFGCILSNPPISMSGCQGEPLSF